MIGFVPPRGRILLCDFDAGRVHPELNKCRRVVVVSPRSYNARHGSGPGRCLVVPFSSTAPKVVTPAYVPFDASTYRSLTEPTWAICESTRSVSHARLQMVFFKSAPLYESLSEADLERVAVGLRHALGIE